MEKNVKDFKKTKNFKGKKKGNRKIPKDGRPTEDSTTRDFERNPRTNDISWYTVDPALTRDAGSLSFNNPLGNTLRVRELSDLGVVPDRVNTLYLDRPLPGVMAIHYLPTPGPAKDMYSPVNVAAVALYSAVRGANSGAKNYDPVDLMKYILAVDSAYSMYAFLSRVYGIARVYSSVNRYWPNAILYAMGVDTLDVVSNLSDLRYYINTLGIRLNTLATPSVMSIFDRHFFMNSGVWKDADMDKSQLYVFVPDGFYVYDETTTPAKLEFMPFHIAPDDSPMRTVSDLIEYAEMIVKPLLASEDIGIISGDLFKCFGMDATHKLNMVNEDYQIYPVFDPTVLEQIHNIRFSGQLSDTQGEYDITEDVDSGALVQKINIQYLSQLASPTVDVAHLLDLHTDMENCTPELVMEASRLTSMGNILNSDGKVEMTTFGSEICTCYGIFWARNANGAAEPECITIGNSSVLVDAGMPWMIPVSTFGWHPMFIAVSAVNGQNIVYGSPSGSFVYETNNYSVVGKATLDKLHECAIMAEFGVPRLGQYVNSARK